MVPLWALDPCLRRLGVPEKFIDWVRTTTRGHQRKVMACGGLSEEAFSLGGLPQGDPLSPCLWIILADSALCHARRTPEKGYKLADAGVVPGRNYDIHVKNQGYADDLAAMDEDQNKVQKTAQHMVTMLGVLNVRVQGKKCIYMRSPAAVEADDTAPVDLIGMKLREVCHEGTLWEGVVRQRETDPSTEEKQYVVELSSSGTSGEERRHIKLTENAVLNQLDGFSLKGMAVMRERKADENNITTTLATNGGIIDFNGHEMPKQRRWTIRYHNEEELVCVDLKTVLRAITRKRRAEVSLIAMDAKGRLMSMECTRVEPYHFPKGETWEERGATKYLGVLSSFAGWEEQRKDILKMNKAITFETALVAPSLRQVMMVQQSCLIARATYPRTVMPADNDSTDAVTASMSKQLQQAMGLRDEYGGVGPPTALLQLSQEVGLGLGAANPASHARVQDARRIIEGLETADDRRAAAIWAALRRTITPDGKTTSPDTDGTTVSKMANLAQYAIVAHQGGGTPRDPGQIIEPVDDCPRGDTLPEKGIAEVELNIAKVEDRFRNEMQIALLAPRAFNDIIEEVREDEAKEGDAEYNELLFVPWDNEDTKIGCDEEVVGYKDLFAAIGMAKRKKAKIVRVLDMN